MRERGCLSELRSAWRTLSESVLDYQQDVATGVRRKRCAPRRARQGIRVVDDKRVRPLDPGCDGAVDGGRRSPSGSPTVGGLAVMGTVRTTVDLGLA